MSDEKTESAAFTMKKLRVLAVITGVLLLSGMAFIAWLMHVVDKVEGEETWRRDGPPSGADMGRIIGSGYPSSITRVVEDGMSSNFNGDGRELIIFCFATSDVPKMMKLLGDDREWLPGLPDSGFRNEIDLRSPADLQIPLTAPASDFIHIRIEDGPVTIIDKVRGISYRVIVRT